MNETESLRVAIFIGFAPPCLLDQPLKTPVDMLATLIPFLIYIPASLGTGLKRDKW